MGYNGNNRRFRADMWPKRGLTNTDLGIISVLIFGVIISLYLIVQLIIAIVSVIIDLVKDENSKDEDGNKQIKVPNKFDNLITDLLKDAKVVRLSDSDIINPNIEVKQKIERLNNNIKKSKHKLKKWGFITKLKKKYIKDIKTSYRDINNLRNSNIHPISTNDLSARIKGYVYLEINKKINSGNRINLDSFVQQTDKTHCSYVLNKNPKLSLLFEPIEFYFFDDAMALATEENYIVIDGNTILAEYRTITIGTSLENKDEKQFNVLDSLCRYFGKDGSSIAEKYASHYVVEIGVLELTISSQKISLLFSNAKSGYMIYKSLLSENT
ncbi:MAG: hypothetical protein IKY64_06275 [Bacteroidaceae bacterium]|nr:hypothetical protein [Bacteroidaceae bacterium]